MFLEQQAGDTLSAFESMSRPAMERAFAHIPNLRNPFAGDTIPDEVLLVELSRGPAAGGPSLSEILEGVLAAAWELPDAPLTDAVLGRAEDFWAIRHGLNEGVKASGQVVAFDLSFARADVNRFRAVMRAQLASRFPQVTVCDYGHVGDGGIHFNLALVPGSLDAAQLMAVRDLVYRCAVEDFHGSFSAEHGLGRMNQAYYHQFTPAPVQILAGQLEALLAPQRLGAVQFGPSAIKSQQETSS
jgi:FAD/FMN-containing dehydrogenase